jgi:hypothetical protein
MKRWQERRMKQRADRAFLEELGKFANLEYLRPGEHGFDYCIEIPRGVGWTEFQNRVVDVEIDIRERFGVRIRAIPVAGAYPDAPGWGPELTTRR